MTMLLNEYIRNVETIRQQKNNKVKNFVYDEFMSDTTMRNSGKVFSFSSNPDESALYSVMRVVSEKSSMGIDEMKHLLQIFKNASSDKTADGLMDKTSFYNFIDTFGITCYVKEQLFRVFDQNRDGYLDLQDFSIGLSIYMNGKFEEKLKLIFQLLDVDRSCNIQREEVKKALRVVFSAGKHKISDKELECKVEATMRTCDVNGDGSIDFFEFKSEFQKSPHMVKLFNYIFVNTLH
ncbi:EF-hand domain-containing protein [Naegleria gruberi]|uniref:EF-hand domain-containing protein n=1 Tax=Naegleria gruberi TaxID=5762 RepID=D2V103_NAEGR|nr:EF-hand domain-containing protein [Naegleria gruberi]EFC49604.1 EF-hand domain-containing protein [Naegleria gruberi]|eukprot:XP_002682348.1 EF-hand domain-containing protein [Naegleria gruberi strain NEG-M]